MFWLLGKCKENLVKWLERELTRKINGVVNLRTIWYFKVVTFCMKVVFLFVIQWSYMAWSMFMEGQTLVFCAYGLMCWKTCKKGIHFGRSNQFNLVNCNALSPCSCILFPIIANLTIFPFQEIVSYDVVLYNIKSIRILVKVLAPSHLLVFPTWYETFV